MSRYGPFDLFRQKARSDADIARSHAAVRELAFYEVSGVYEYDAPDGRYAFERADEAGDDRRPRRKAIAAAAAETLNFKRGRCA